MVREVEVGMKVTVFGYFIGCFPILEVIPRWTTAEVLNALTALLLATGTRDSILSYRRSWKCVARGRELRTAVRDQNSYLISQTADLWRPCHKLPQVGHNGVLRRLENREVLQAKQT